MGGIVVVGVGAMGWNHARVCSELGLLSGVCDNNSESVKSVSEKFSVPGFTDINEAIEECEPLGVIIATPTFSHFDLASLAIESGVNVLLEKPMTDSIVNGRELIKKANEKGVKLAIGHIERFNPVISATKEKLVNGDWGDIVTITSRRVSNFPGRIRDVGVVLDLGIHDIDNSIFLMSSRPRRVYATGGSYNEIDYEDHATICIEFENGNQAIIEVNWITPMKVRTLSLTCQRAFVELDYIKQEVVYSSSIFKDPENPQMFSPEIEVESKVVRLDMDEPLKIEILDFIGAIEDDVPPAVDGEQGLMALEVALAALKSMRTGEVEDV